MKGTYLQAADKKERKRTPQSVEETGAPPGKRLEKKATQRLQPGVMSQTKVMECAAKAGSLRLGNVSYKKTNRDCGSEMAWRPR
jgi:hypothetical protein